MTSTEKQVFYNRGSMRAGLNVEDKNLTKYNMIQKFNCQTFHKGESLLLCFLSWT